jgi:hypothetical protein
VLNPADKLGKLIAKVAARRHAGPDDLCAITHLAQLTDVRICRNAYCVHAHTYVPQSILIHGSLEHIRDHRTCLFVLTEIRSRNIYNL